ncbi:MAG TPA: nucleotidyltransferase [Brumimicrobium sp.]|nr:nucleotidyltransferase [Brumimicrobium sp.]
MLINPYYEHEQILVRLAKSLDITQSQHDMAVRSYKHVAEWLSDEKSPLAPFSPDIIPQGSFLLGTIIQPIIEGNELDVDLVCQLNGKSPAWTQFSLKQFVGNRIKAHGTLKDLLDDEGRRCWTLVYADSSAFHMDILPAIINTGYRIVLEKAFTGNDEQEGDLAIRITDNTLDDHKSETNVENWPRSNPFGYALWFNEITRIDFEKGMFVNEAIQPLPKFNENKLPLQRAIQILKRHRDIMFGKDDDKPISIIITTLAARSYNKQTSLIDTLSALVSGMRNQIEERFSYEHGKNIKWVGNPLNVGDENDENFADKWPETPQKETNFYAWLDKLETDFEQIKNGTPNDIYELLKASFGSKSVNEAFKESGYGFVNESFSAPAIVSPQFLAVSWRMQPEWPLRLTNSVEIHARYKNGKWKTMLPNKPIPKGCDIEFVARTNVKKPYQVYWQIVNTGDEMGLDRRGGIIKSFSAGAGGLRHQEKSAYKGVHWAECFIVKNGICVARSSEFFVQIN